ncbi:MAG: hypothetical protein NZL95_01830 [Chitinophagales bacterium]|nr:hypothetical protein [Chitinophagales bacterium]MDW8427274.1 hypothetical protein [Chitinophagales bacterium]
MLGPLIDFHHTRQRVDELNREAVHDYLYHWEEAFCAARQAELLADEIDYPTGKADALQNQARCARVQADFRRSANLSLEAYRLYQQKNHTAGMADALANMAFMQINLENYTSALTLAARSVRLAQLSGHPGVQSFAFLVKGMAYEHLWDYERALHYHRQALAYSRTAQDTIGEGAALLNLGIVLRKEGRLNTALEYIDRAYTLFLHKNLLLLIAAGMYYQAKVYEDLHQLERAEHLLEDALGIVKNINHAQGQGPLYLRLGSVCRKQYRFAQASEYLIQSIELSRSYGKHQAECKGLLELALCEIAQGSTTEAIHTLSEADMTAELADLDTTRCEVLECLAKAYAAKGKWRQAFETMQHAAQLRKHVFDQVRTSSYRLILGINPYEF